MKLEITKDRILEAASKCSTAKETLKTLFPEVFKQDIYDEILDRLGDNVWGQRIEVDRRNGELIIPLPAANTEWSQEAFEYALNVIKYFPRCLIGNKNGNIIIKCENYL